MSAPGPQTVLLDLDGTLVDPARGILSAFVGALAALGRPAPPAADLRRVIGPPLRRSFAEALGEGGDVAAALAHYRAAYGAGGLFDATPYPGAHAALRSMREQGRRLLICTAKPAVFATRIIDHFGFASLVEAVYGPDLDGRFDDKGDLIAHMLERERLDPATAVMVGDRGSDIAAARRNAMRSIGVLWGFGDAAELAGADALCAWMAGLPDAVAVLSRRPTDRSGSR